MNKTLKTVLWALLIISIVVVIIVVFIEMSKKNKPSTPQGVGGVNMNLACEKDGTFCKKRLCMGNNGLIELCGMSNSQVWTFSDEYRTLQNQQSKKYLKSQKDKLGLSDVKLVTTDDIPNAKVPGVEFKWSRTQNGNIINYFGDPITCDLGTGCLPGKNFEISSVDSESLVVPCSGLENRTPIGCGNIKGKKRKMVTFNTGK